MIIAIKLGRQGAGFEGEVKHANANVFTDLLLRKSKKHC